MTVLEPLGFCLVTFAGTQTNPDDRQKTREQARKYLEAAKALGDNSEMLLMLLEQVHVDSHAPVYSENPEVNELIRTGEEEFAKGHLDQAKAAYQQAILLEPTNYPATLYLGDLFFKQKEYGTASEWLKKASEIDPNRDEAFRYWGDALERMNKPAEAREKFIQAVIAQPYSNNTWRHLQIWAKDEGSDLTFPHIQSPNSFQKKSDKEINITIDSGSLDKHDGTSAWMLYSLMRASWQGDEFKKNFPDEKAYRHSLKEESLCLNMVAMSVKGDKKIKNLDPQLAILVKITDAGLLEPYILLNAADQGIAQDYADYRKQHRDLLYNYLDKFVVPPPKASAGPA
jgi:tetratricopeptide (TPR) repeat protein